MDLDEIRALLAVAETGSFVAAARATSMTRSTLRRRVDELEARVGARLLDRTPGGATVTTVGAQVVAEGRLVAEHARAMVLAARSTQPDPLEPLHVVMQQGLPPELQALMFGLVSARLPGVPIVHDQSPNPRSSLLEDADLVVAVSETCDEGPWIGVRLRRLRERLLASREYLARRGRPASLADLAGHTLAVWQAPGRQAGALPLRWGGTFGVAPQLVSRDMHLLHTIAGAGHAIVHVPDGEIHALTGIAPLEPVLDDVVGHETSVWLIVPRAIAETPRIRALVDGVRSLVGEP